MWRSKRKHDVVRELGFNISLLPSRGIKPKTVKLPHIPGHRHPALLLEVRSWCSPPCFRSGSWTQISIPKLTMTVSYSLQGGVSHLVLAWFEACVLISLTLAHLLHRSNGVVVGRLRSLERDRVFVLRHFGRVGIRVKIFLWSYLRRRAFYFWLQHHFNIYWSALWLLKDTKLKQHPSRTHKWSTAESIFSVGSSNHVLHREYGCKIERRWKCVKARQQQLK